VRRKIERYGLTRTIDPRHFFPTVDAAVSAFRAETGAQWTAPEPAGADPDEGGPDEGGPAGTAQTAADPTSRT
jgi:hypothetical protein